MDNYTESGLAKAGVEPLHCLTWDASPYSHLEQVEHLCAAGARWIQLRMKLGTPETWLTTACAAQRICSDRGVRLVLNDFPELARDAELDGVHVGLSDTPVQKAREILGPGAWIGGTAHTAAEALRHIAQGADYVGLGPLHFTGTKENLRPVLGLSGVEAVVREVHAQHPDFPLIVIGGITSADILPLRAIGAFGVAICSAVVGSPDIAAALAPFLTAFSLPSKPSDNQDRP